MFIAIFLSQFNHTLGSPGFKKSATDYVITTTDDVITTTDYFITSTNDVIHIIYIYLGENSFSSSNLFSGITFGNNDATKITQQ